MKRSRSVKLPGKTRRLRNALRVLDDELDISKHEGLLRNLDRQISHSIRVVKCGDSIERFNCFMHGLDLIGLFGDQDPFTPFGRWYVDSKFVEYLVRERLLQKVRGPRKGLVAIYFDKEKVRHAGLVASGQFIVSKWGCGNLYCHPTREVSASYGNRIRYFEPLSYEQSKAFFERYRNL